MMLKMSEMIPSTKPAIAMPSFLPVPECFSDMLANTIASIENTMIGNMNPSMPHMREAIDQPFIDDFFSG